MYNVPLYDRIKSYGESSNIRFHMPGHGGVCDMGFLSEVAKYDITELDVSTNVLDADDEIAKKARSLCAEAFGALASVFSCSGATLALQTALLAAKKITKKSRCLCDRRCHRSVIHALTLLGMEPVWFLPDMLPEDTDCKIMIFTSCDYYGAIAPLAEIADFCKRHGILSVADNSHGTHLRFVGDGRLHPLFHGIDLTVDSAHKTLPVLTGGAYLHLGKGMSRYFDANLGEEFLLLCMALFSTTSPSFLIAASLDLARGMLERDGRQIIDRSLKILQRLKGDFPFADGESRDPFRLVIMGGRKLYEHLKECGMICEFCDGERVILIPRWDISQEQADCLYAALKSYDAGFAPYMPPSYFLPDTKSAMSLGRALYADAEQIDIMASDGRISAKEYSPYPPGIPVIVPGEVFDMKTIGLLKEYFGQVKVIKQERN